MLACLLSKKFKKFNESCSKNLRNLFLAAFEKEQDSLNFLNFLKNKYPNIKFMTEKQVNHSITFLDVFISGINSQNLTLQTYQKLTYTRFPLNFKTFILFLYKIGLDR